MLVRYASINRCGLITSKWQRRRDWRPLSAGVPYPVYPATVPYGGASAAGIFPDRPGSPVHPAAFAYGGASAAGIFPGRPGSPVHPAAFPYGGASAAGVYKLPPGTAQVAQGIPAHPDYCSLRRSVRRGHISRSAG